MVNAVIDLSHWNTVSNFDFVRRSGIYGVIHKATQGTTGCDPAFQERRQEALEAGLAFGAYHFGTGDGSPEQQVDHFLNVAGHDLLLALDFETNPSGASMSLGQAEAFVQGVFDRTGRYPGLYGGYALRMAIEQGGEVPRYRSILSRCWLWVAEYADSPTVPALWRNWTLWQYTDGTQGPEPHTVPGVGTCDRDQFNGDHEELAQFWAQCSGEGEPAT